MNEKLNHYEEKMKKTMANLEGELAAIRAGRANPNVLNQIMVDSDPALGKIHGKTD